MNIYQKKKLKRVAPSLSGALLAFLTIIKPIAILFLLPISIFLFKKEIVNKPLVLFLISFTIIYLPFMYFGNISMGEQLLATYNILKEDIIDTNLGSIKSGEQIRVIDDFEEKNNLILKPSEGLVTLTITDKENYEGKKAARITIKAPIKEEVMLRRKIEPSSWGEYNYLNLWVKNKGELGWFGVYLIDIDGEWWNYDSDQVLKEQKWTLIKIPIASLKNYGWTKSSNGKMDNVVEYQLKFHTYAKKSDYEAFVDYIYLSKF